MTTSRCGWLRWLVIISRVVNNNQTICQPLYSAHATSFPSHMESLFNVAQGMTPTISHYPSPPHISRPAPGRPAL